MFKRQPPQVFISYSREDQRFAEELANSLTHDGISVWFDDWYIQVGDSILRKIQDGILSSDFLVVLLSRNSMESKWVDHELNAGTLKNIESEGVFVLPALIEKCRIPPFLSDRKFADFTSDPTKAYQELLAAIDHHFDRQGCTRKTLLETRLSIVHVSSTEEKDFPIVKFTVANRSGRSQIIKRLEYDIVEYHPYLGIPETRVLKPIVHWDIPLPYGEGTMKFIPDDPVLIADDDAAVISLRFHSLYRGNPIPPKECAGYTVRVRFVSDQGIVAASELFRF